MTSKTSKDAITAQFRQLTNATQTDAVRLLKSSSYRLERAVEAFYSDASAMNNASKSGSSSSSSSSSTSKTPNKKQEKESLEKLNTIFDQFKDSDGSEDEITIEGTMEYCSQLEISPEDVVLLPLSFYLQSPTMGKFTRKEFINGWKVLSTNGDLSSIDTIASQKNQLPELKKELLADAEIRSGFIQQMNNNKKGGLYKKVYEYTYNFARPEGQKSLPLDTALAFWDLLLPNSPTYQGNGGTFTPEQLQLWKEYLTETTNNRAISKDTWSLFLDFTRDIDPKFQTHDLDAAWPSVIDGFVAWAREKVTES
ncbi:unnamed protein product [Sympodiomycopsis kandeliae]